MAEVAAAYGVHRSWVYRLLARYRAEGDAAFVPRSRRPRPSPTAVPARVVDKVLAERDRLTRSGHDAGPETITWHLSQRGIEVSRACNEPPDRTHTRVRTDRVNNGKIARTGELIRQLTLDPSRRHNPKTRNRMNPEGSPCRRCPETSHGRADRI